LSYPSLPRTYYYNCVDHLLITIYIIHSCLDGVNDYFLVPLCYINSKTKDNEIINNHNNDSDALFERKIENATEG